MERDVFISYAHEDKLIADAICAKLEENKIRCWIAPRDITPGEKYAPALINAIEASKLVVVVFSHSADKSPHVMTEIERAFNLEKIIIPFRIENILPSEEFQYFIGRRHWLDALSPPMEDHITKLIQVAKKILEKNPEFKEKEESTISLDRGLLPQNFPVTSSHSQKKIYVGAIIAALAIIVTILIFTTSFPSIAFPASTGSSDSDKPNMNSTSISPSLASPLITPSEKISSSTSAAFLLGNWSGYYASSEKGDEIDCMYHSTGNMNWIISSTTGDSFSGSVNLTGIEYRHRTTCQLIRISYGKGTIQGRITGNSLEGTYDYYLHYDGSYKIRKFTANLSNGKISGLSFKTGDDNRTGTFTITK